MVKPHTAALIIGCLAASATPCALYAQDMGGVVGFNNVTSSICGGSCDSPSPPRDSLVDATQLNAVTADPRSAAGAAVSDFTYTYSPARTRENLRNFVANTPDPAARASYEQMFAARPALMDEIREGIRSYGYDSHNVADAYGMWMMIVWLAGEGRLENPDRETAQNVAAQVRNRFAATPDFAKSTDADRQQFAEVLLLQATILAESLKATQGKPELASQLSDIARKLAQEGGLDLSTIILTSKGFVPRKGG